MQSNQVALIEPRPVSYTEAEMHKTHVNLLVICFTWCKDNPYHT